MSLKSGAMTGETNLQMPYAVSQREDSTTKKLFKKWRDQLPLGKKSRNQKRDLMQIFPEQMKGIGNMPRQYKIELNKGATSVQLPVRDIPESIQKPLDRMKSLRIIANVTKPTDCGHNLIYMVKNDESLRICLDPHNMNHWICLKKYFCFQTLKIFS